MNDIGHIGRTLQDLTVPTSQRTEGPAMGQDDFMKIMIEQLRSQNPLEPQGNNEFFAQMVQFQSLEAMQGMANAIKYLTEVSELAQASSLVGREVTALVPQSNDPATGMPRPHEEVSGVVERVTFSTNGAVVHLEGDLQMPIAHVVAVS